MAREITPARAGELARITTAGLRSGGAVMACPYCGGEVNTANARAEIQLDTGLRWVGVPCLGCPRSFTVELTEAPDGVCNLDPTRHPENPECQGWRPLPNRSVT